MIALALDSQRGAGVSGAAIPPNLGDRRAGRGRRILLAEDNLINQRVAIRLLEKAGHYVVLARNGREAVAAIENGAFDLVLMDIQMPEMDGFEATAAIRRRERGSGPRLPIVALTAHAMKGDAERCLAAGMDAHLVKPIHAEQLYELLDKIVTSQPSVR